MKIAAGFLLGVAAAWAAIAIWQRIPPFPELEPEGNPPIPYDARRHERFYP